MRVTLLRGLALTAMAGATVTGQTAAPDMGALLAKVGAQIELYYARAQAIMCRETVRVQPVAADMSSEGMARHLEYEMRVEWAASADGQPTTATVSRELLRGSRRQIASPGKPECLDPKPVSPEPLTMLLPSRQGEYEFTWVRNTRTDRRDAAIIDYRPRRPGPAIVAWDDDCGTVDVPALLRGRVWVDRVTGEVLRVDERLGGQFDIPAPEKTMRRGGAAFFVLERADSTIRYKPVSFSDPTETLMLPASIDTMTVIRNSGVPRLRTSHVFSDYRRFLTAGRVVE